MEGRDDASRRDDPGDLLLAHLPALLWALLCAMLLLAPGEAVTPDHPGLELLEDPVHGGLAFVQAWLVARSLRRRGVRAVARAATATAFAWLLLLEAAQIPVPGRDWEWSDLGFAAIGAAAAGWLWNRLMRRRGRPRGGRPI